MVTGGHFIGPHSQTSGGWDRKCLFVVNIALAVLCAWSGCRVQHQYFVKIRKGYEV